MVKPGFLVWLFLTVFYNNVLCGEYSWKLFRKYDNQLCFSKTKVQYYDTVHDTFVINCKVTVISAKTCLGMVGSLICSLVEPWNFNGIDHYRQLDKFT